MFELHEAAKNGDVAKIRELVGQGYSVNEFTYEESSYFTPLHYAAKNGHTKAIECLINDYGAKIYASYDPDYGEGETPLETAVINKQLNAIKCLVKCGANVNVACFDSVGYDRFYYTSLLHIAVSTKDINVVRCVVALGANVDITERDLIGEYSKDGSNQNALHVAIRVGSTDILRYLINDCKATVKNIDHLLHEAVGPWAGHVNIIRCLIQEFHANPNSTSEEGNSPLHLAAHWGHVDAIRELIKEFHLNPNSIGEDKNTPLHFAVNHGKNDIIRCLIVEFNADLNIENAEGKTPPQAAKNEEIKKLILTLAAEQEAKKKQQRSPSPKAPETLQSELQQQLSVAPLELVNKIQTELTEAKEKYDQILADKKNHEEQLENLRKNQTNPEEIKKIQSHLAILEQDRRALEPLAVLKKAESESLNLFAQNPNAIEFYNTTYAFLKAFFNGISAGYNPVIVKQAKGTLTTIASVIARVKSLVSFLPFGAELCSLLENRLNNEQLKILKKRIKSLTHLSQQPGLPLIIENIACELTLRHEESITRIDNTQHTPNKWQQAKDKFYKEGEFSSIQNLAEYAVSMMIGDMLEGENISTKNLKERCLAVVLNVSSKLGFIAKEIEAFFSQNVVRVKINNQSSITQNYHYRDFFTKLCLTPIVRNRNNNNAMPSFTSIPKVIDVTFDAKVTKEVRAVASEVELKLELETIKEQLKKKADAEQVITLQERHEQLSTSHSFIKHGLSKLEEKVKKDNKTNSTSVDVSSSQALAFEMPLESPTRYSSDAFGSPIHTSKRVDELSVELQIEREKSKKLEEKLELLTEKIEILEEEKGSKCVPKGCSII